MRNFNDSFNFYSPLSVGLMGIKTVPEVASHIEYGCWISPENQVENTLPKIHKEEATYIDSNSNLHADLYRSGYVEIRFGAGSTMELWGMTDSIRRSKNLWTSLAASVQNVVLCTVVGDTAAEQILDSEIGFSFPSELSELENFLGLD